MPRVEKISPGSYQRYFILFIPSNKNIRQVRRLFKVIFLLDLPTLTRLLKTFESWVNLLDAFKLNSQL
ncbi:hypothetical protein L1887_36619 [Cichorium endivia]|nr:hypothetical protein L1887_36619 [Cichorium endivia]